MCRLDDFFNSDAGAVEKLRLLSKIISMHLSECKHQGVDTLGEVMQWQECLLDKIMSSWRCIHGADGPVAMDTIKNYPSDGAIKR